MTKILDKGLNLLDKGTPLQITIAIYFQKKYSIDVTSSYQVTIVVLENWNSQRQLCGRVQF